MEIIRFYKTHEQLGFTFLPYKLSWGRITHILAFHLHKFEKPKRKQPLKSKYYFTFTIFGYELKFRIGIWFVNPFHISCENWIHFKNNLKTRRSGDYPF